MTVRVQHEDFNIGVEIARLRANNPKVGAVACFIGIVRDLNDGTAVGSITLEHYPGMTEKSLASIAEQARARWSLLDVLVIHRVGTLAPTDQIVLVATASSHRGDAFAACQFVMDYLKTDAPFWKKESTDTGVRWVDARDSDADARDRWKQGT
ncbi:MAG TPA: molybdopterin synthase catalytic subunit MoaE [Burkholderiaceae bacterium]|nr:molybdopterin synthase catalytic subunit MoaE [Burkholderiaceae bacterium]